MKKLAALTLCALLLLGGLMQTDALSLGIDIPTIPVVPFNPIPLPTPTPTPKPSFDVPLVPIDPGIFITLSPVTPAPTLDLPVFTLKPGAIPTLKPVTEKPAEPLLPMPTATPAPKATPKPAPKATPKPAPRGQGDEATSFGLYMKELRPAITDKWYMLLPLDLAADGVVNYPLVADNAHIVGAVNVTVAGGRLRVELQKAPGLSVSRELMVFFAELDAVQTLNPDLLAGQHKPFGTDLDIAQTFGEDRKALLYINLAVGYKANGEGISAFSPELYRPFMQNLLPLLD